MPSSPPDRPTIHEKLVAILGELPAIGKDARNTQQNFNYRSHDAVLNALNPLFAKHGVVVVPRVLERITAQRTTRSGTIMYEVNLHVEYLFYGSNGDYIQSSVWGEGTDSGDKATNKAMTMAFKNVLAQVFAISTADTIDTDAHSDEDTVTPGNQQATEQDLNDLYDALSKVSWDENWSDENVIKSAAKRFRRPITMFEDLTLAEVNQIREGALAWNEANPKPEEDAGDVPADPS